MQIDSRLGKQMVVKTTHRRNNRNSIQLNHSVFVSIEGIPFCMSVSQAKKPPFIASPIFPFAKKKKTGKKLKKWVHTFSNSNI